MERPYVIVVDEHDVVMGQMDKLKAHQQAILHRAFSVTVQNSKGELLLQKRASHKYHSAGLWTNTCCSHPQPSEKTEEAAAERLMAEMGIYAVLRFIGKFTYRAEFKNGLTEHEIDHVFLGQFDGEPILNPDEAESHKWLGIPEIHRLIAQSPDEFTPWFRIIMAQFFKNEDPQQSRPLVSY
jgi:isopentenyl-diphosphate delta-isomerase